MNFLKIAYLLLVIIFVFSFFCKKALPTLEKISPDLLQNSIQTETKEKDFKFEYRGENYHVIPVADYELWGLVVSHNNINSWFSYYHDKNSVNLKDICVVWGENIKNEVYREAEFKSGEFTCFWKVKTQEAYKKFKNNQLSNNHLLSSDPDIQKIIKSIKVGDQVYIKGMLVRYAPEGSDFYRKTSLTRDDTGAGACETFYVQEIKILKRGAPIYYFLYKWSRRIFVFLIILQMLLFFKKAVSYSKNKK